MSSKFLKVIFAVAISVGMVGQANASLIEPYFVEGQSYTDFSGNLWEYVGYYDLSAGPNYVPAPLSYTGETAAVELFGLNASLEDIAISAFLFDEEVLTVDEFAEERAFAALFGFTLYDVNFSAWYDVFEGAISIKNEDFMSDVGADGTYNNVGDASSFVNDRAPNTSLVYINYVFTRVVDVPAPASIVIVALALCGLFVRRVKS